MKIFEKVNSSILYIKHIRTTKNSNKILLLSLCIIKIKDSINILNMVSLLCAASSKAVYNS